MENKVLYQIKSLEKVVMRKLLHNHDGFTKEELKCMPTATQHQIMRYIIEHRDEEIYQKDLENVLNLRRATVSGVLQTMEKHHLIERVTDSLDTRTKKIILNEAAKKIFSENEKRMKKLETVIKKDISEDELEVFYKVVTKMKDNIKNID